MSVMSINKHAQTMEVLSVEVEAFSTEHAKRIASLIAGGTMDHVAKVTMIKQPRPATTCKTDDNPVKGTRKWKTVYQVYAYGSKIAMGRDSYEYLNKELVRDDIDQKTDAVKIAKEMAIKHQLPMTVQIAQKLDTHSNTCADIEPKSTLGKYKVEVVQIP